MAAWLGPQGRSDEDLERIRKGVAPSQDAPSLDRIDRLRYPLKDAHGHLLHSGLKTTCVVQEIGIDGCSVQTDRPFRDGALAQIEVVLPLFGMLLHMPATTEMLVGERLIEIRFNHKTQRSKTQLAGLIACLTGASSPESVWETLAAKELNASIGDVLLALPPEIKPKAAPGKVLYDPEVHAGEGRLQAQEKVEWPVVFRSANSLFQMVGALVDLSLGGCTIRTVKPLTAERHDAVEVDFDFQGLHFQIAGITQALYDTHTVGVRFNPMARRRREDLAQSIEELCVAHKLKLETA
jgi:hypothetical protein